MNNQPRENCFRNNSTKVECKFCSTVISLTNRSKHENACKKNPNPIKNSVSRTTLKCPHCEQEISKSNLSRHAERCSGNGPHSHNSISEYKVDGGYQCPHCGIVKSKAGIGTHIWRMHGDGQMHDPNIGFENGTRKAWNDGITTETHPELKEKLSAGGRSLARKIESGEIPCHFAEWAKTPEARKMKSEWRKALHISNPETHPNRRIANNKDKMTFPEKLIFVLLTELEIPFEHNKKVGKYYPDFTIGKNIIEVDGEQWHQDKEKDQARDNELNLLGYAVHRFPVKPMKTLEERVWEFFDINR